MLIVISSILFLSVSLNIYQFYKKKKKPLPESTLDAKQLLSDLLNGGAMVRIDVIDPTHLMLRSPN